MKSSGNKTRNRRGHWPQYITATQLNSTELNRHKFRNYNMHECKGNNTAIKRCAACGEQEPVEDGARINKSKMTPAC
jgi:hypothetical protein